MLSGDVACYLNSLERKGRLLQHTYLDYSISRTFSGQCSLHSTIGPSKADFPNFLTPLGQTNVRYADSVARTNDVHMGRQSGGEEQRNEEAPREAALRAVLKKHMTYSFCFMDP